MRDVSVSRKTQRPLIRPASPSLRLFTALERISRRSEAELHDVCLKHAARRLSKVLLHLLLPPVAQCPEALELGLTCAGDPGSLREVNGTCQVQLGVPRTSADAGDRLASNTDKEGLSRAVISGLDADGGQAGDGYMHSEECTSGDQKPGHPRFSAGKVFSALGPHGVMLHFAP